MFPAVRIMALRAMMALAPIVIVGAPAAAQTAAPPASDSMPTAAPRQPEENPYRSRRLTSASGFVATYFLTVLGAGAMGDSFFPVTAIPVVGPWMTLAVIQGSEGKFTFQSGGRALLVTSGLLQGALLISWLDAGSKEREWARRVVVVPTADGVGLVATLRF